MTYRIAMLLACLLAFAAVAQNAPDAGDQADAAAGPQSEESAAGESEETTEEVTGAADARAAADDDFFVPTEEFDPDEQVNFPVDI